MDIVERVARAIAETGNGGVWTDENWYKEYQRDFHRKRARAAIEAMREPTYAMRHADDVKEWPEDATACWKAMIDAALKETTPA